jgi:hypothetical protein
VNGSSIVVKTSQSSKFLEIIADPKTTFQAFSIASANNLSQSGSDVLLFAKIISNQIISASA